MPTLEITASMQKLAHIAFIAKTFNESRETGEMIDKSSMQKLCYLVQEMFGAPLGYEFRLYSYGPYCADLTGDIEYAEYLMRSAGPTIAPGMWQKQAYLSTCSLRKSGELSG